MGIFAAIRETPLGANCKSGTDTLFTNTDTIRTITTFKLIATMDTENHQLNAIFRPN